jgi:hypothetical protein
VNFRCSGVKQLSGDRVAGCACGANVIDNDDALIAYIAAHAKGTLQVFQALAAG